MKLARLVVALSLATALGGSASAIAATVDQAQIVGFAYSPDPLVVSVGESVQWTNVALNADHSATLDATPGNSFAFDTGIIAPAEVSSAITMTTAGIYTVHCSIHGFSMTQQLIVQQAPPADVPEISMPALLTISAGVILLVSVVWSRRVSRFRRRSAA